MTTVTYTSWFSGIGGFELGLEQAAKALGITLVCLGYSEIDKSAIKTYEEHYDQPNFGDITKVNADELPDFDLFVGGFPCQAFSIGGKRLGFEDTRGTLFFDVARILATKRPRHFILENVKGLLSHDGGRTFRVIIRTLTELGYGVQWQVLNSKDHGVPQNRERVYIVGHLGGTPRPEVFPFTDEGNPHTTIGFSTETAVARTLTAGGNSGGNHSGMTIIVDPTPDTADIAEGEGIKFGATRDNRTGELEYREKSVANTINSSYSTGIDKRSQRTVIAELRAGNTQLVTRRLTPTECERLQGFPDGWTSVVSDTQRYKQCGNAVTVNVVRDVALRLFGALA